MRLTLRDAIVLMVVAAVGTVLAIPLFRPG
jgi:hypothetical protein